jgi:DNA-binding NarL/FixJ family response regulator
MPTQGDVITVALLDDNRLIREALRALIERTGEFRVVGEAELGDAAAQTCQDNSPDLSVMDIGPGGMAGAESIAALLRQCPGAKLVALSAHDDERTVVGAIRAGARAVVLKKSSPDELFDAMRITARGGSYLSPRLSDRLLERLQNGESGGRRRDSVGGLSPRELQVMRLVAGGKTSKEAAEELGLSLQTVRSYRKALMKKLGVGNVAGLTQIAIAAGVTPLTER